MTQGENLSHDTLVTSSRLRDAPQYKQVIGTVDGPVRHGVVTIRMHHVLRNWGNDSMNRPDAEFVPAHQLPSLYTSAFAPDVTVISRDQMLELIADQKQLAQGNVEPFKGTATNESTFPNSKGFWRRNSIAALQEMSLHHEPPPDPENLAARHQDSIDLGLLLNKENAVVTRYRRIYGLDGQENAAQANMDQFKIGASRMEDNIKLQLTSESSNPAYQLLGRLQQDCDYYLGAGNGHKKHLWASDEAQQIQKMKELYGSLPVKPEWITLEAINSYEEKMVPTQQNASPANKTQHPDAAQVNMEPFKVQEYASYKDLVKTPEAHVEFLRVIGQEIDDPKGTGSLYARLSSSVRVKDAPFSQAAHLTALESNSDGWDMDEVADSVKVEIAQLSAKVKEADPGYDVPHFTTGFEWMIRDLRERGVSVEGGLHFEQEKEAVSGVDYESPSP